MAPSLTATLEYVEEKTSVNSVFVNFQNDRNDRGRDLLCLSQLLVLKQRQQLFLCRKSSSPHSLKKGMLRHFRKSTPPPPKEIKAPSILFIQVMSGLSRRPYG